MPKITIELEVEGGYEGQAGSHLLEQFYNDLCEKLKDYSFGDATLLGTTLTQDELDSIRFRGEGGND